MLFDPDHTLREKTSTNPEAAARFGHDPVGLCRWENIHADFSNPVYQVIKNQSESGQPHRHPSILIPIRGGQVKKICHCKPRVRRSVGRGSGPGRAAQGYMVMGRFLIWDAPVRRSNPYTYRGPGAAQKGRGKI